MSQTLSTVSNFNLEQYLGTWYEIARLPMKHQPEDSTDISAVYSLNENGKVRGSEPLSGWRWQAG